MLTVRKSQDRGHADHGWLNSFHSFSFAGYHDPAHMGFGNLRVINEDRIAPGTGFGTHGHRDMEIISYVLEGSLGHKDSMGNAENIVPGEVQRLSAGTGITHSEFNPNPDVELHLYQIWILPNRPKVTPRYAQQHFAEVEGRQLILSPDAAEGSLQVYQDMRLWRWQRAPGAASQTIALPEGRRVWLQGVRGVVSVDGQPLAAGDGLALWNESELTLDVPGDEPAELLWFDLS